MSRKTKAEREDDLLSEMSKNIGSWYDCYDVNYKNYRLDKDFLFLSQWDNSDEDEFKRVNKPMMSFNKLYDYFKKLVGEQRNNTPNLKVRCLNGDSTQEAISLRADLVRQIAYNSNSDIVYQTAFENMLSGGMGAFRVITDYENSKSFDQQIKLAPIRDTEKAFFDPNAQKTTKSDGEFCGYYDSMPKSEFEIKFPDVPYPQSFPEQSQVQGFNWGNKNTITIVEYYKKEWFNFSLHRLSDDRIVTDKEYKRIIAEFEQKSEEEGDEGVDSSFLVPEIVATRKSRDYKIMMYKAIYGEILEKAEWPSKYLPIIFSPGDIQVIDGKERTLSLIRFAKDAQRFLNYCGSEIAQSIVNHRREQFIGTPANVSGALEKYWRDPSVQQGILLAEPDPITQRLPEKLRPSEISQSVMTQFHQLNLEIQSILGFYEANRGAQGQELSGIALRERQRTGNLSAAVFFSNLDRAIEQAGRVIMDLMPKIYDTERKISLTTMDGKDRDIILNQQFAAGQIQNDITKGEYDVVIEVGGSFAVQRAEAMRMLIDMVKVNPQTFPLVADLIAENLDIENNPQLVERFKTLVPPNILAKEEGKPPPPPQPNPQAMLMQQQMQIKQAELQLKQQEQRIEAEKALREEQLEAAKLELEMAKLNLEQQTAGIRAGAEISKAQLDYESDVANALSRILTAEANVAKHNSNLARDLISSPSS
jgi:hypothetical protein